MTPRVRPKGTRRAVVGRRTVASHGADALVTLDDRPLRLALSRDGKRVLVTMPYEIGIVSAASLELERSIPLSSPRPSVFEGDEGVLWLGGQHLFRSAMFGTAATKVGTKLGGVVDWVCLLRARQLCGVGVHGEVLWDVGKEEVLHRRKASEHPVFGLVPTPDGRAVWAGGHSHVWVIDPDHLSGYTKLKLKQTSTVEVPGEAIEAVGLTRDGSCVLAARDGAVAWTNRGLRIVAERYLQTHDDGHARPLAISADAQWVYVVRPAGVLHRFLLAQPKAATPSGKDQEPEPWPEAEQCRLNRIASCVVVADDGGLVLGGPHADDQLGRLWRADPQSLAWEPLVLGQRTLVQPAASEPEKSKVPSFVATRTKVTGSPLASVKVDDVLAGRPAMWVTRASGGLLERPIRPVTVDEVMPGDTVLLPAMLRMREGTTRPALLLWPAVVDQERERVAPQWLTWGDDPRGWMPLRTLEIREQGWSRRDVFPLQIALPRPPPEVPGYRTPLPTRWVDAELFAALGRECKKLLKVLW